MTLRLKPLLILITLLLSTLNATQPLAPLIEKGEPLKEFYIPKQSPVSAVAISEDGSFIVSGSWDNSLKIWDTKSGKLLKMLEGRRVQCIAPHKV